MPDLQRIKLHAHGDDRGRLDDRVSAGRPGRRRRATEPCGRSPAEDSTEAKLDELARLREEALHAGDERSVARQRERGKLLARERLEKLLDPGSFVELTGSSATAILISE